MRFDNENTIVFRNKEELAETIKKLVLRYDNKTKSSPLLTWGEFKREGLGVFKNNDININYFTELHKEEEVKYYSVLPIDFFRNGYEMVDCDGHVSDEIPFTKRRIIDSVKEDNMIRLSFNLNVTPVMFDYSTKGNMVEESEGVYRIEYPHEIQINFDIKLSTLDQQVTKFSQLYFYVTDVVIEVLK